MRATKRDAERIVAQVVSGARVAVAERGRKLVERSREQIERMLPLVRRTVYRPPPTGPPAPPQLGAPTPEPSRTGRFRPPAGTSGRHHDHAAAAGTGRPRASVLSARRRTMRRIPAPGSAPHACALEKVPEVGVRRTWLWCCRSARLKAPSLGHFVDNRSRALPRPLRTIHNYRRFVIDDPRTLRWVVESHHLQLAVAPLARRCYKTSTQRSWLRCSGIRALA
jgi:hypothetical protein